MLKFSIKNAFRKKSTAILSSIGVGVGLMLVFVIGAFTAGVSAQFADNLTRTIGIVNVIEKDQVGFNSQLYCYVLIGKEEQRLRAVREMGVMPFAQLYQAPVKYKTEYTKEMKKYSRLMSRPAITRNIFKTISWRG